MDKYILKVWSGLRNEITFILSPTEKWGTKTEYTKLKKFLHKDGYLRIAPEHAGASTSWKSGHTNVTSYPMSKTYSFGIDVTF